MEVPIWIKIAAEYLQIGKPLTLFFGIGWSVLRFIKWRNDIRSQNIDIKSKQIDLAIKEMEFKKTKSQENDK